MAGVLRSSGMRIHNLAFDAENVLALAAFWSAVLDLPLADGASDAFARLDAPGATLPITFVKVPEGKTTKNRVHVDLRCSDLSSACRRLESLGAARLHEKYELGWHWVTFEDPEGNEFCIAAQ